MAGIKALLPLMLGGHRIMAMELAKRIEEALCRAVRILPDDVETALREAYERESGPHGRTALKYILEDIAIAKDSQLPLCQDCGMFLAIVSVGRSSHADMAALENAIVEGCRNAALKAYYRRSVVTEPVYARANSGDNLPPVVHWELVDGDDVTISFLLKGFGSENCSAVRMLRPTEGEDGVVSAVLDMVRQAGGKPCPPMFLGLGIGGTMDKAAFLSKKALLRPVGTHHPDRRYAALEERLMAEINSLGIGPGGLGGVNSCLEVAIETAPTHIAGLPVALSVNCWAERRAFVTLKGGEV